MACNCKHMGQEIDEGRELLAFFRNLFIKRMTVDSNHNDRRRKDYNQAIFHYYGDEENRIPENTYQVWSEMDMAMVLQCFDDAVKDWRKSFCDVENCNRK